MQQLWVIVVVLLISTERGFTQSSLNYDEMLNRCIDGQNHKSAPGPESELYSQCKPWEKRSCCTYNTTRDAHTTDLYNFNFNHCNRNLSTACKRHFMQDFCFYECSPNVGPWVQKVDMKTRKERFFGIPLCMSDCDAWFNACRLDLTCASNWIRNFDWAGGKNKCHKNAKCDTFENIFGTADNFCSNVWDGAWKVVPDEQSCMRLWFNPSYGNPNDIVAKRHAELIVWSYSTGSTLAVALWITLLSLANLIIN